MAYAQTFITEIDERTGKQYSLAICDPSFQEKAVSQLKKRMDYDYFESLPAKERAKQKITPTDFTCPHCKQKSRVTSRKEKVTVGFIFFVRTYFVDIFTCECGREFKQEELDRERFYTERNNKVIQNFESWKDAKRDGLNPPEFASLDKVDKFIISDWTSPYIKALQNK